jgi:hypothetical protein
MLSHCRALTGRLHLRCRPRSVNQTVTLTNNARANMMDRNTWDQYSRVRQLIPDFATFAPSPSM